MVRDERGQTPPVVQQFLLDLLAYNDNLTNPVSHLRFLPLYLRLTLISFKYSDTFYLTTLFDAIGHSLVAVVSNDPPVQFSMDQQRAGLPGFEDLPQAVMEASEEIDRYMSTDRLVPSYHNAITVAGIQVS